MNKNDIRLLMCNNLYLSLCVLFWRRVHQLLQPFNGGNLTLINWFDTTFSCFHLVTNCGASRGQRGWVVGALDLKSGDPEFKSRSDRPLAGFLQGGPWFNSSATLVQSQLVCLLVVGIFNLLSLFELRAGPHQPLGFQNLTYLTKKYI